MNFNKKYAIRKLAIGVASVAIGISFIDGNVLAAPNSNEVSYTNSTTNVYRLDSSENTINLHEWIKEKIKTLDFSNLTRDEFYGLVSEDGKTYGDVRKIVSDWNSAKILEGTYSIKKLTIVDIHDTPISKMEKIVDKENNNEIKPLFYSTESVSGDSVDNPVFYTTEELAEKYKNANPNYNWEKTVLHKEELEIPYGNRNLKISYFFNKKHEIGTKTKVEFVGDKIKVRTRKLVLKDKIVDEHNNIQNFEVIENNYELDDEPRKIVKETTDMVIDEDPGILHAIPEGKTADEKIKQLQSKKTGYVFKVKSYEEDGTTSYRYFRTWTTKGRNAVSAPNTGDYVTEIPYSEHINNYEENLDKNKVNYTSDVNLEYGKIKVVSQIALDGKNNISLIRWENSEPENGTITNFVEEHTPILTDDDGIPKLIVKYPETPNLDKKTYDSDFAVGIKPIITREIVENRVVKYRANENLDTDEKVIQARGER